MFKFKNFYAIILVLFLQFLINLDPFIFSNTFANNIVFRYFPLTIILIIAIYKSNLLYKISSKSFQLLLSTILSILLSIIASFFIVNWYTYKIIFTGLVICLCLHNILKNKFSNVISAIISIIFGILFFTILNQATQLHKIINIGEHSQLIINIALISMAILLVNENIENIKNKSIILLVGLTITIYIVNILYLTNIKSKIDNIDNVYNTFVEAIDAKKSNQELKNIINLYPNFPDVGTRVGTGNSLTLNSPEGPYTLMQVFYNYVFVSSINREIDDNIPENSYKIRPKNYSVLKFSVSVHYEYLFNPDVIEIITKTPFKCVTIDFISNLFLIAIITIIQKIKFKN